MVKQYLIYSHQTEDDGPWVRHSDFAELEAENARQERVIAGLNKQLTEQFELSSKFAAEALSRTGAVKVKTLEWRGTDGVWAKANALFGATYRITQYAGMEKPFKLETVGFVGPNGHYELIEEAKAAAQADYERRILSALEPAAPEGQQAAATPAEALKVLEPFAKHCKANSDFIGTEGDFAVHVTGWKRSEISRLTVSDFRAARAFVEKHGGKA